MYSEAEVREIAEGFVDLWESWDAGLCNMDEPTVCLKTAGSHDDEEFAWDDVNNIALLLVGQDGPQGRDGPYEV